jgi:AcrR family transcriptional regulator
MSKVSTKTRILDAAEELFSEKGFAETSMRDITSHANVNLASVNYHFGSKDELINAVFLRVVEPLIRAMNAALKEFLKMEQFPSNILEQAITVLVKATMTRGREMKGGGSIFMRLLNRAYSDPEAKVRNYLVKKYSPVLAGYVDLLATVLPNIEADEIYWRFYYMLGSLIFVMSSEKTLIAIAKENYNFDTTDDKLIFSLVKYLAAGFRA